MLHQSAHADEGVSLPSKRPVSPSLVGWGNLILPGLGATLRGEELRGLGQFGYEVGTLLGGYFLTDRQGFTSLDGATDTFKPYRQTPSVRKDQQSVEAQEFSDMLLEFSFKSHMVNTFIEYRDAYRGRGITEGLDQHTIVEGFSLPLKAQYMEEVDVWLPLLLIGGAITADYFYSSKDAITPLNGASNMLYDVNNVFWQPLGSGYPEEAFYRGFLQHEISQKTESPLLGVLGQSLAFALSHEAGKGRYPAFFAGGYLGWLAYSHNGDLGPGTTLHFWSEFLLGIEAILLSHKAQRTTPQGGLSVQFNY